MLLNEYSAGALESHRRERFVRERTSGSSRIRESAVAVLVAAITLAACGVPLEDPVAAPSKLIVDLAPVGSPNISEFWGYVYPEMFPVVANQSFEIDGYATPEMWPEAAKRDQAEQSAGPR